MQDVMYTVCKQNMLAKLSKSNKIEVQTVSCDAPDDGPYSASLPSIFTSLMLRIQLYQSVIKTLSMTGTPCQPTSSIHRSIITFSKELKILLMPNEDLGFWAVHS